MLCTCNKIVNTFDFFYCFAWRFYVLSVHKLIYNNSNGSNLCSMMKKAKRKNKQMNNKFSNFSSFAFCSFALFVARLSSSLNTYFRSPHFIIKKKKHFVTFSDFSSFSSLFCLLLFVKIRSICPTTSTWWRYDRLKIHMVFALFFPFSFSDSIVLFTFFLPIGLRAKANV